MEWHEEQKERRRLKIQLDDAHRDYTSDKGERDRRKEAKRLAKQEKRRLRDDRKAA